LILINGIINTAKPQIKQILLHQWIKNPTEEEINKFISRYEEQIFKQAFMQIFEKEFRQDIEKARKTGKGMVDLKIDCLRIKEIWS